MPGACACGGSCPRCDAARVGYEREADDMAAAVMRNAAPAGTAAMPAASADGAPLPRTALDFFEPRFGADFGDVRVHAGDAATAASRSLRARAYTLGRDIVFNRAQYAPHTSEGRHLLAHELAHVVQQRAGRGAGRIARKEDPADWHGSYKRTATSVPVTKFHSSTSPSDYDTFKDKQIGTGSGKNRVPGLGPASQWGGTPVPDGFEITRVDLEKIFLDLAGDTDHRNQIDRYCAHLTTAFRVMQIDTVEAMALYLAHAASESDQFRKMTETQATSQRFEDDPTAVALNTSYLTEQYMTLRDESGAVLPGEKKAGMTVNPPDVDSKTRPRDWAFIGRGPVQTTHRDTYIRTLAYLEKRAEQMAARRAQLEQALTDGEPTEEIERLAEDELLCRDALAALKADPRQAANPRYAFLFAAATMHMSRGVESSGTVAKRKPGQLSFDGKGAESTWVTGGKAQNQPKADGSPPDIDTAKIKKDAYGRAVDVLGKKAAAMAAAAP